MLVSATLYETSKKTTSKEGFQRYICAPPPTGKVPTGLFRFGTLGGVVFGRNDTVTKLTNPHIDAMTAMATIPHTAFDLNFANSSG